MDDKIVLATGFGPFGNHKVNASWEAVKLLNECQVNGYKIVTEEIPVAYEYIDENVPKLWEKYKPFLVIHVGVSHLAKEIMLELRAHRSGYAREDCNCNLRPTGEVCDATSGDECISTEINAKRICEELQCCEVKFGTSTDAGRYLCEFIYYKSLHIDPRRTLFVHVPMLGEPYSAVELADGIRRLIDSAVKQMNAEIKTRETC